MTQADHIIVSGAPEGFDAKLILEEVAARGPVIHVARDDKRLAAMQGALRFFAPDMIACPMTACRPMRISQRSAWRRLPH